MESDHDENRAKLRAMEDRALAIFDQIWGDYATELDEKAYAPFSRAGKAFVMIFYLDWQVQNGGFFQWIGNPTGMYVRETRDALIEIGSTAVAELVNRAMSLFPDGCPSRDYEERWKQLRRLTEEEEDTMYVMGEPYENERYNLFGLLLRYWDEHGDDGMAEITPGGGA